MGLFGLEVSYRRWLRSQAGRRWVRRCERRHGGEQVQQHLARPALKSGRAGLFMQSATELIVGEGIENPQAGKIAQSLAGFLKWERRFEAEFVGSRIWARGFSVVRSLEKVGERQAGGGFFEGD